MIEIISAATEYPEKLVVATFQRTEIWQVTKMPFSDQRRAISRVLEQRWQRGVAGRQADVFGSQRSKWLFQPKRQTSLIAPRNQRCARRRAVRGIGVRLSKFQSLGC